MTPAPDVDSITLDDTDKAVIEALQVDGRLPYSELGPMVGLSQAAVRQRVKRLLDAGVMQVVAVTDPARLGVGLQALVGITVDGDLRAVGAALAAIEDVDYVVITTGRFDVFAEVVCADAPALLDLVNEHIRPIDGVRSTEVFAYLDLVKQTYAWGTR